MSKICEGRTRVKRILELDVILMNAVVGISLEDIRSKRVCAHHS